MWDLDHKQCWVLKDWCFWIVVLEKTLKSPLDSREIKAFNPKGNQPWIFIGRTDDEAEAPLLGHLKRRANSLEKTLMLGKIEGRKRRGWQRMSWLDNITDSVDIKFEQTQGDCEGQELSFMLQTIELQRVGHDPPTEQQQHEKSAPTNLCSLKSYSVPVCFQKPEI